MMRKLKKRPKLYPHQKEALKRALNEPLYALFMEQGTGKTPVAIKAIEQRYRSGVTNRVIIFAPATILYNWELEISQFLNLPKSSYVVERLRDKNKNKRLQAYKDFMSTDRKKLLILLVNYEKSRVMYKELKKYNPQFLIIDESQRVKNNTAQISKNIYKLTRKTKYRLIMTGTPICNGYEDLFMQYKIMDSSVLGTNYKQDFESRYVVKGGYMGHEIKGYRNEDELRQIISETSYRIKIEDCVDLPSMRFKFLTCELNPKAQKLYNEMNEDMVTQLEELKGEYTRKQLKHILANKGVLYSAREPYRALLVKAMEYINTSSCDLLITKIMRLQQISGGFITMDEESTAPINISTDKLSVVKEVVLDSTHPVLIFCQYTPEIELIVETLSKVKRNKKPLTVASFRNPRERDILYDQFHKGKIDVLILQLKSGSVGLNLQRSNKLIFYSWSHSAETYNQAISRIKRNGQLNSMEVIHIIAENTIDIDILNAIKAKQKLAKKMLD